jgi:hypothetical protein
MAFKQEVNVPMILTTGIISGILILVIVIGMQAWYTSEEQNEIAVKAEAAAADSADMQLPTKTLAELVNGQKLALAAKPPHWIDDKKKDRATIPIEDAKTYLENNGGKLP